MFRTGRVILSLFILGFLATAVPAQAAPVKGLPDDASLLFTLDSGSGRLKAVKKKGSDPRRHFRLTLNRVNKRAVWFTDRPDREAGRITARSLFKNWKRFGFEAIPPNAALVVSGAHHSRDTMAVELILRRYMPRKNRAVFLVRALDGLGNGLKRISNRVDRRISPRFGASTLFIDNASLTDRCSLGQPQLFASTWRISNMARADGSLLPIKDNIALYSVYGTQFGGDDKTTFALPKMEAPPGMSWWVCLDGNFPTYDLSRNQCELGEVDYWAVPGAPWSRNTGWPEVGSNWLRADGRTVTARDHTRYVHSFGNGASQATLPTVPAPPGMISMVCVKDNPDPNTSYGQMDMFVGEPRHNDRDRWIPADGRQLRIDWNRGLFAMTGTSFGAFTDKVFTVPDLPAPVPGLRYYVGNADVWPGRS